MENKTLRGAVITLLIALIVNECASMIGELLRMLLSKFADVDMSIWYTVIYSFTDVTFVLLLIAFIIAGIALLADRNRSALSAAGGGLLMVYGAVSLVRVIGFYICRWTNHYQAMGAMVHQAWFITLGLVFCAALLLIAVHYHDKGMIGLAIAVLVLRAMIRTAVLCYHHDLYSFTIYVTIAGIIGIALFVVTLIYIIRWNKCLKKINH